MNEIKPAFKTLEGQSVLTVIIGCLYFLYSSITGSDTTIPVDQAVQIAREAVGIMPSVVTDIVEGVEVPALLIFIYKILDRFITARTELKK